MQFKDVLGHTETKELLIKEFKNDRVSHAQMFIGPEGSGKLPLAIAFSQYLLCDSPAENDSCGECPNCLKTKSLVHPDLHFVFPVVSSKANKVASSEDRRKEWNEFVLKKKYFNLNQWQESLDEMGKKAIINVEESRHVLKKLSLKSYSGKYKIMIIWLPEKMNIQAANKLLKLLEEPPEKTIFLLVSDNTETIIPTILSRTQFIRIAPFTNTQIEEYLGKEHHIESGAAHTIAGLSQGNLAEAISMSLGDDKHDIYFDLFVKLMRSAYAANPINLIDISEEIAALDRESQKNFLKYGLHIFRESIILNYMKGELVNLRNQERAFLSKFAKFINNQNITELMEEFNESYYHIERNANAKILFSDLVIKLTKLIKKGVKTS